MKRQIGRGGMGVVYLAEDTSLGRKVALKFLNEEAWGNEPARKRFLREARSAAAIDHPYACKVYEVGQTEGQDFIAMEYVEGQTLQQRLLAGRIDLSEGLLIAGEIPEALGQAHGCGIVHRDLKPSNIMLTVGSHVKVMDFGLAKRLAREPDESHPDSVTGLTRTQALLGTPAYMSPEQIRGEEVDHRSDIFSFGIVLYEMLTGSHPFHRGQMLETTAAILNEAPRPLSLLAPEVPEVVQRTVDKMLAKKAQRKGTGRFSTQE